jgi:multidrug efflux pump subunit AcrA (membrane-fusion protein)
MKPGQRVKARIVLDELDGVLTVPRGALAEKDGKRVVYRLEGGRFRPVEVVVGCSSLARVVVTQGLAAGDRVALRDPTRALSDILKARAADLTGDKAGGTR